MKELTKKGILSLVSSIVGSVEKEDITNLFYGHHKCTYSIRLSGREIQEVIITGMDCERDGYILKVRTRNPEIEDAFFSGEEYYENNKKIFKILHKRFQPSSNE